jgi:hypothetical protein
VLIKKPSIDYRVILMGISATNKHFEVEAAFDSRLLLPGINASAQGAT